MKVKDDTSLKEQIIFHVEKVIKLLSNLYEVKARTKIKKEINLVECYFPKCQWEIGKKSFFFYFAISKKQGLSQNKLILKTIVEK